ncbi:heavy metal-associated isoprenylated plant protein 4-like [Typha angustifolia]|uniref:heavy metal-associated isoprenylated plant protein 4-like n=1 Tax=Typha angustifolia TaxID=59011 RepID=UPI003C2E63AD
MGASEKKEVVVEKKEEVITAIYKLNIHCKECARVIENHITRHQGVQKVDINVESGKVTVKGVKIDVKKIHERLEKKTRKKVELLSPLPKKEEKPVVKEEKKKEEVVKTTVVKVHMHCDRCAADLTEVLLQHKSIHTVKTNREAQTCTIIGTIEEKKLIEYIRKKARKHAEIIPQKQEKKVEKVEEKIKVEAKVGKEGVKIEVTEKKEKEEIKSKDIIFPYFIPCTHPHFMNCTHPDFINYPHPAPFLHCMHPTEYFSDENPNACSVM